MDIFVKLFSGIGTFFIEDPKIAIARFLLIVLGFILAWMGFRRKLEPLIMVPMGLGMIAVNAGVLFLAGGQTGTLILDPMVSEPNELVNLMQVNFLQPVYNFTFSNGLIACIVFFGIGAMSDISFILLRPGPALLSLCSPRREPSPRCCWVLKYSACPPTKPRRLPLSAAQMGRWCSLPPLS